MVLRRPIHVQPSMLVYALSAETADAWLGTPADFGRPASWAAEALGTSARMMGPRSPADSGAPAWLTRFVAGESPFLAAPAPRLALDAPQIDVVADARIGDRRRLELRVRPAPGTYSMRLRATEGQVLSAAVDGRDIDDTRYRTRSPQWTLGYVAPAAEGFTLALTLPLERGLTLDVVARSLGLPPSILAALPSRPERVVPVHTGDYTVVHRRVHF
jgi:hypothetical protein